MVKPGVGIAIMPAAILAYQAFLQARALPLTDTWARMQLYLVCDSHAVFNPEVAKLLA